MENPKRLKSSTAVRLGSLMSPFYRTGLMNAADGSLCAMGAAYLAETGKYPSTVSSYSEVFKVFPEFEAHKEIIWNLNYLKGREGVADFLESQGL